MSGDRVPEHGVQVIKDGGPEGCVSPSTAVAMPTPAIDLRDRVAEALGDSIGRWWQTPLRLDYAAGAVMPVVNDAIRTRLSNETTRADQAEHRLAQVEGAARRELARADDAEATRDRWRERAEKAEQLNLKLIEQAKEQAATIERMSGLIDSYPPGSNFAQSGAQDLFRRMLADAGEASDG